MHLPNLQRGRIGQFSVFKFAAIDGHDVKAAALSVDAKEWGGGCRGRSLICLTTAFNFV